MYAEHVNGIQLSESEAEITNSSITYPYQGIGLRVSELSNLEISNSAIIGSYGVPFGGKAIQSYGNSTAKITDTYIKDFVDVNVSEILYGEGFIFEGANATNPAGVRPTEIEVIGYQEPEQLEEANLQLTKVNRFFQYEQGFHFYTADANESTVIQAKSANNELSYN